MMVNEPPTTSTTLGKSKNAPRLPPSRIDQTTSNQVPKMPNSKPRSMAFLCPIQGRLKSH